jgi:hypothetical protein
MPGPRPGIDGEARQNDAVRTWMENGVVSETWSRSRVPVTHLARSGFCDDPRTHGEPMKPSDFMLGLLDFFAVLMPGALGTLLLAQYLPADIQPYLRLNELKEHAIYAVIFGLTAYAVGHFVFMAGSRLDDLYEVWRKKEKDPQKDTQFRAAKELRGKLTPNLVDEQFSTLKWAKSYLGIHAPEARLEIDRFEATSKFFRGFVVVSAAAAIHYLASRQLGLVVASATVSVLSFWRFCDQRWKMTELACASIVIFHETKSRAPKTAKTPSGDGKGDDG